MMRLPWLWPATIILSALGAGLANLIIPGTILGTIVIIWFLFVCPGMVLVRALDLNQSAIEWTLALALSLAIDAIVAGILLYAGKWSPTSTLEILIGLCLGGGLVQLISLHLAPAIGAKQFTVLHLTRSSTLFAILLTLLVSLSLVVGLWPYGTYSSSHSAPLATPHQMTPHTNPESTVVSTPTLSSTSEVVGAYSGTIYNIPVNLTTKMSLTGIQQGNVSGIFTGLLFSSPFKGSLDASKHIHFMVTDATGKAVLSFDGTVRADGNLVGNYCGLDQQGQCGGKYGYGIWSVGPAR
ncbi:MAG: hypothetical protein NVSMB49_27560 [Ktedonobacteraceae bacterium]